MEPERSAASLAMQSHHILFWSCRHWGSPLSPLLTIRTCHWIPFKKTPYDYLPSFPPPLPLCFSLLSFFFCLSHYFTCHLPPPPSLLSEDGNSLVTNLIYHFFYFCWRWRQEKRESILETFVVKEHTSFPAYSFLFSFSFFVLSSSPSWLSLWGYHSWFCTCKWYVKGGYCVWIPCPLLLLLLVFFFFSLGGAGVGWRTEARWEITGMGSH